MPKAPKRRKRAKANRAAEHRTALRHVESRKPFALFAQTATVLPGA
jgi:hypothetical protein